MDTTTQREHLTQRCLELLASVMPNLDMSSVSTSSSLMDDLMLDSFLLASFVERLEQEFGNVDMTRWFMIASNGGQDTIDGLVTFIVESRPSSG